MKKEKITAKLAGRDLIEEVLFGFMIGGIVGLLVALVRDVVAYMMR